MLTFYLIILLLALPFVGIVWLACRSSGARFPILLAWAAPFLFALGITIQIGLPSNSRSWVGFLVIVPLCSVTSLPALWRVVRLAWILFVPPLAAVAAIGCLYVFERGTHGPWYIRSEGLAIMLSMSVGAASWHGIIAATLLVWVRTSGRRQARLRSGQCEACGYNLTGLTTERCPECGCMVKGS